MSRFEHVFQYILHRHHQQSNSNLVADTLCLSLHFHALSACLPAWSVPPRPTIYHSAANSSLAAWGRKEIVLAEHEMPGLMYLREKFGKTQPLKGARGK